MPYIDKKHILFNRVLYYNEFGIKMANVCEVNTDKGWIEMYVQYPSDANGHVKIITDRLKQELVKVRVHCGFEIRSRETDVPLYKVTWTWLSGPYPVVKEYPENIKACFKDENKIECFI